MLAASIHEHAGLGNQLWRYVSCRVFAENHGYDLTEAMSKVIHEKIRGIGGYGGMIGIDKNSNISMDFNTAGMYRAFVNKNALKQILLYEK